MRVAFRLLIATAVAVGLSAGAVVLAGSGGEAAAQTAKAKAKAGKRLEKPSQRVVKRPRGSSFGGIMVPEPNPGRKRSSVDPGFPGVYPVNPGLRMPNVNRPPYNSGTVAPLAVPRQDPITPGVGVVPQHPPAVRGPESYQDRVSRCSHQAGSAGLSGSQRGPYIHNCSM